MADNTLAAASMSQPPQAANRERGSPSVPPSSAKADREYVFMDSDHPEKVLEGLNRLRLNTNLCDVILCCEDQEVPCHRYVLASFSPYFEAMFASCMRESSHERVTISGVEPQMIGLLVNYAYTSKVSITSANVQALLAASNLLDVAAVLQACCEYMMRHMDIKNCVGIYCFAETHSCEVMEKRSKDFILQHFSVVYRQEEFPSLSVDRLAALLASDHLHVPKEDVVFEAAMLWLAKCPETRKHHFDKVLEQIRLPLISPSYLNTVLESLEVVRDQQGCQSFIAEAKDSPYCKTARPRRTTEGIMVVGFETRAGWVDMVESFSPQTKQWKTVGQLPLKVAWHAVVESGSYLYLAGGFVTDKGSRRTGTGSRQMWRYDVERNSWLKMASMHEPRMFLRLVMLGECVFAVGGQGGEKSEDSLERYHPQTNSWTLTESVGVAAYADNDLDSYQTATVVALDGLLYFIGGMSPHKKVAPSVAKYDPEASVLTEVAPMRERRNDAAACTLNGKIYVTGGNVGYPLMMASSSVECYDPQTNQWSWCGSMPVQRYMHSAVAVDGRIYALGGRDDEDRYPRDIIRYCEETNTWETVGKMASGRYKLICVPVSLKLGKHHAPAGDDNDHDDDDKGDDEDDEDEEDEDSASYDEEDEDDYFESKRWRW